MDWYLIQTKPNAHLIASKNLRVQNFDVFLPLVVTTSRQAKKFVTNTIPLFSGYLFMGSKLRNIAWKSVNATRGVSKVVTFDGQYRPISCDIVNGLKSRCDTDDIITPTYKLKPGDYVKIEKGPFSNFICEVEKVEESKRLWLLLEIMQQKTRSQIRASDVVNFA